MNAPCVKAGPRDDLSPLPAHRCMTAVDQPPQQSLTTGLPPMKTPDISALFVYLLIAASLPLASCTSVAPPGILPTTPSEAVCNRLPRLPVPPIPNEQPEIFATFRRVIGLYINEINKYNAQAACRAQVHATYQEAP
ncbi:hypothetical protein B9J09_04285 [Xylella fastidiosa subsp. pauca]|uniref:hypothetical protein n=2 Tax=Xylella fastidiosa TaxID=2371 RepID=UPI0009BA36DE|nr:hypothetical protein [Xylella fastidiosa]ARO68363.1 hypothetical protein B9J09_04285 [Xylella fastidiosa subsp. pauca]TNW23176.1 hypothetical protein EIP73_10090 [Xylella fastidiosa subsp. pauca]TNW25211.1 hypothetical protein EIP74_01360 [Xylella fastidiosa subsp. pauca]